MEFGTQAGVSQLKKRETHALSRGYSLDKSMLVAECTVMNSENCKQLGKDRTLPTHEQSQEMESEENPEGFLKKGALKMSPEEQKGFGKEREEELAEKTSGLST